MWGSTLFRWLMGEYTRYNGLSTSLNLSDADADAGTLGIGQMINYIANSHTVFGFTTGKAIGILMQSVDEYGTTSADQYRKLDVRERAGLPWIEVPAKKGQSVACLVPYPGSMAEFDGVGAASYGNRVITATTTGFLASGDARDTELSVEKGGWKKAQAGEMVLGTLEQANLTTQAGAGGVRIRVKFCSPYKKA